MATSGEAKVSRSGAVLHESKLSLDRKRKSISSVNSLKVVRVAEASRESLTRSDCEHQDSCQLTSFIPSETARRSVSVSSSSMPLNTNIETENEHASLVDLTVEKDSEATVVVDLTDPVKICRNPRPREQIDPPKVISIEDEDNDVIILPNTISTATSSKHTRLATSFSSTSPESHLIVIPMTPPSPKPPRFTTHPSNASPGSHDIVCPICMDSKQTFTKAGRALVATNCGHVFCDGCIRQSIQLMHRCPTCSKKLSLKQYHKIYI